MKIQVKKKHAKHTSFWTKNPARVIVISFAALILFGTLLLMMPFSSANGAFTPFITALFTATSATCVTGLILVDTGTYWSIFGQSVILFLIQVGGLGLVTFATLFNIMLRRKMRFRNIMVAQESVSASSFSEVRRLITTIFTFSLLFELLGAVILGTVFVPQYGTKGIFLSAFISVSAYCNGGFDILGFQGQFCSVTNYWDNPVVLITIAALITCGGLGFIVWQDLYRYKKTRRLSFHTKVVLVMTVGIGVLGTLLIAAIEWGNPKTLGEMPFLHKIINSAFLCVSTRTAGFNSFSVADMSDVTKAICTILMFIGASPAGTGGGIKVTTALVLVMTVICVLRGLPDTVIHRHKVEKSAVYKAITVTAVGLLALGALTLLMCCTPQKGEVTLIDAVFEAASAFGTVGISDGVTGVANLATQIGIVLAMFLGRVGPISLGLSLGKEQADEKDAYTELPEGKLLVG